MEKKYDSFRLVLGNIADFNGDSIVVPCWSNLGTGNVISDAINERLKIQGARPVEFEPWRLDHEKDYPLFSAHYAKTNKLQGVDSIILAACYVDEDEKEFSTPFYLRAAKTTANVLEVANANQVNSIAFPAYMTGQQRGAIDQIVPAMLDEFQRHHRAGRMPKDISLYLFDLNDFNTSLEIAKHKLRK